MKVLGWRFSYLRKRRFFVAIRDSQAHYSFGLVLDDGSLYHRQTQAGPETAAAFLVCLAKWYEQPRATRLPIGEADPPDPDMVDAYRLVKAVEPDTAARKTAEDFFRNRKAPKLTPMSQVRHWYACTGTLRSPALFLVPSNLQTNRLTIDYSFVLAAGCGQSASASMEGSKEAFD